MNAACREADAEPAGEHVSPDGRRGQRAVTEAIRACPSATELRTLR
jgi:hypothetical protein